MNALRPRTITIKRNAPQTGVGAVGYGGVTAADEQVILEDIEASIQNTRIGRDNKVGLPMDRQQSTWKIFYQADPTLVRENDLIYDDLGRRFRIIAAYPHALGYTSTCEQLEV
jgi:hypothetical protein